VVAVPTAPLPAGAVPFPLAAVEVGCMVIRIGSDIVTGMRPVPEKPNEREKLVETDAWAAVVVPDAATVFLLWDWDWDWDWDWA